MKLYTFAALLCVILVSSLILSACSTSEPTAPTQFETGKTVPPLQGCFDLRNAVEKYNNQNGTKMEADC